MLPFAQATPPPTPEQLQKLAEDAERIRALTADEVAKMSPEQVGQAAQTLEQARWVNEVPYFRQLHELLPEPFFQTQGFLLFFIAVAGAYWLIPRRWNTLRVWLLVIASFHFYAAWNASLAFLVTTTATLDYLFARGMDATNRRPLRRTLMWSSIAMNLGVLAYFKYRGFFLNELHELLRQVSGDPGFEKLSVLDILIPFGISFYTFEAISYAVDVAQGKIRAERSLPHFMLFILFFPHLVAGPIVRAGDFLRQAHRPKRWNWVRVQVGVQFFLLGLFKKLAIADRMAIFCDPVFRNPEQYNTSAVWLAVLAYALRIYADFSGYSDMAIGTAHLFGFRLTQNFNMPYLSPNSGAAGTSRCRAGCATTCSFPWGVAVGPRGRRIGT
jgi:alginate O-acetyltransferase complex protein AlgI